MTDGIGYNREEVEGLRTKINETAIKAGEGIVEILHSEIIIPMSSAWYAPEAVEFFTGFSDAVRKSGEFVTEAFDGFRETVQSAGKMWAENTKGDAPQLTAIDKVELNLTVSEIQPQENGKVIIYTTAAETVANKLPEVEANIKDRLQTLAEQLLNADQAFIGLGQADAIETCFSRVSGAVHQIFKFLTEGEDSLQSQIKKASEKYGELGQSVSNTFNSASVE